MSIMAPELTEQVLEVYRLLGLESEDARRKFTDLAEIGAEPDTIVHEVITTDNTSTEASDAQLEPDPHRDQHTAQQV